MNSAKSNLLGWKGWDLGQFSSLKYLYFYFLLLGSGRATPVSLLLCASLSRLDYTCIQIYSHKETHKKPHLELTHEHSQTQTNIHRHTQRCSTHSITHTQRTHSHLITQMYRIQRHSYTLTDTHDQAEIHTYIYIGNTGTFKQTHRCSHTLTDSLTQIHRIHSQRHILTHRHTYSQTQNDSEALPLQ